jgi:ribonuclease HI
MPLSLQAEVYVIKAHVVENLGRNYMNIYILSDSQASSNHWITSNWSGTTTSLSRNWPVHLVWVPGHEGINGNEMANQLAKLGSERPSIGPE